MAAIFRQIQLVLVGEPGQLRSELVALAVGRQDRHGKAFRREAGDDAFDAADMVNIGNHAFALLRRAGQRAPTRCLATCR
jgi:hypothetical protein